MTESRSVQQMMTKASVWLHAKELEQIDLTRGDISRSLFIRRAIRNALEKKEESEGGNREE
jgi:metal-responsive CopG/Arc/MetJ family transcriptional regulator